MKKFISAIIITLVIITSSVTVFANEAITNNSLKIEILSPSSVKDYPGREESVKVKLTNNANVSTGEMLAYITMADMKKNMTVNLEDYNADKPIVITGLKANESRTIDLPVRFVYTSNYHLYVTVAYKDSATITSSESIPIEILGNTKIDKSMVIAVSGIVPLLVLGIVTILHLKRRRQIKAS